MEVITSVKACLVKWEDGGESECRTILTSPHCHLLDPGCADVLSTAYQTLLHSVLGTWSLKRKFTTDFLVAFIQDVLGNMPSSSSASSETPQKSQNLVLFGELLVDVIWAIDAELDEILADARLALGTENSKESSESQVKAGNAKRVAECDKETLADFVKRLLIPGVLNPSTCRERLDIALLTMIGLIPDKSSFEKKEIRTRTALFYKQNKFNLLREQSEGYTKLTTDLIGSLGPAHSLSTGRPSDGYKALLARASSAWERVVSLVGYFDLDPNRALDIILDVFSVNIATHWQFFLALLSCSPWSGDSMQMRDWEETTDMKVDTQADRYRGKSLNEILEMAETNAKGSKASSPDAKKGKPKVLAQVLGFKFSHYQSPETLEPCPRGLYLAAALLIRENFITLEDLYPHLGPTDEDMPKLKQKYLDDVQSRIKSSSNNLLAMAAPLESASSSSKPKLSGTDAKPAPESKQEPAQKAMIVNALLSVGMLRPALAVITRFPWLVDLHREIADNLLRAMKIMISPLYESMLKKERNVSFLQPRSRYASAGLLSTPVRRPQLTLCAPTPPSTHTHDFVFFYPQWIDWIPVCSSVDDLVDVVEPLMKFVGLHISREPLFVTKFLRIGKIHLSQSVETETDKEDNKENRRPVPYITEPQNATQSFWLHVARRYLFPALSMMPGNAVCTVEVWNILRQYETTVRWRLYGEWRDITYKSHPELNAQKILREREAKGVLRRLSSQTVESLSGAVAKMAHSNPCIFFTNAINQIQAYDNLADVVIQALRFATNMGFDILIFIILDAFANPHKDRMKEDGANASDWLQSLATFTGALYRRYSSDLSPLLKYIVHQLYNGQTSEIIVLEKLILKMAGIEPLPSLSDAQITAMAGGPTLRIEAVASDIRGAGFEASEASQKGTQRLGKALMDSRLAFPILVQVAQQRQACVFKAKDAHLKSIAYLFDATHGVLFQYLDLLTTPIAFPLEDYRTTVPSLSELGSLYGISAPISMQIFRPLLNDSIAKRASDWCKAKEVEKAELAEAAEKRLKAALAAKREPSGASAVVTEAVVVSATPEPPPADDAADSTEKMEVDTTEAPDAKTIVEISEKSTTKSEGTGDEPNAQENPWIPELFALFEDAKQVAPGNSFEIIGPGFFLTFWQMSSYDLYFPKDKYAETEKALLSASEVCYSKQRQADRSTDKSIRLSAYAHRSQRERYLTTAAELKKERAIQEAVFRFTTEKAGRLDREKPYWFSHVGTGKVAGFILSLIEHCIQPRCLMSPMDADYCSRLIRVLHDRGTPGFHTLMCYDKLLGKHVKVVLFSCSENEARNYGRFLRGILQDLYGWHKDQKLYDSSNRRKEGSKIALLPGLQIHWSKDGPSSSDDILKWADFKSFLKKCHRKLGECFTDCIQAGDFMHIYNAVLVLKEIIGVFPIAAVNDVVGSSIDLEIQRLVQNEERGDLKILARAYSSSLKKRESLWAMSKAAQASVKPPLKPASPAPKTMTEKPHETVSSGSTNLPSGPRVTQAQLPKASEKFTPPERPGSAKLAIESIPRPEVVKRNRLDSRPDSRPPDSALADAAKKENIKEETLQVNPMNVNGQNKPSAITPTGPAFRSKEETPAPIPVHPSRPQPRLSGSHSTTDLRREVLQATNGHSRPSTPQPPIQIASVQNPPKDVIHSPRLRGLDAIQSPMAPPNTPSQTHSAQELRNTRSGGRGEKSAPSPREPRVDTAKSPARRSPSPPSRPGTRNASADSRTSGDKERERGRYERLPDLETAEDNRRANLEAPSRAERSSGAHRDVLHGRSERERNGRDRIPGSSTRDADKDKDSDRERDKGREREADRDREREREREKRDRDRDSHRERERDKDRDGGKDRDRHRREEKDRDRKELRGLTSGTLREADLLVEHGLPSRPDGTRHRTRTGSVHSDELLGKRRRPADDDPERTSKRSSRKEGHREERARRVSEKEGSNERPRESERRRKDRDGPEGDTHIKGSSGEKHSDRLRGSEPSPTSAVPKISIPPSAPRAMAASPRHGGRADNSPVVSTLREREREHERERSERDRSERTNRGDRTDRSERPDKPDRPERGERNERSDRPERNEREWKTNRETLLVASPAHDGPGSRGTTNGSVPLAINSLRERIGGLPSAPSLSRPPGPSGRGAGGNIGHEDQNDARKRTMSERERNALLDAPLSAGNSAQVQKRPRIDRTRYTDGSASGLARRTLNLGGSSGGGGGK